MTEPRPTHARTGPPREAAVAAVSKSSAADEALDEVQLAAEIARIRARRGTCEHASNAAAPRCRWLGDEADAALVASAAADPSRPEIASIGTSAVLQHDTPPPVTGDPIGEGGLAPSTLAWVRTARHQRMHARLLGAAGWAVTVVVSVAIAFAATTAILLWNGAAGEAVQASAHGTAPAATRSAIMGDAEPIGVPSRDTIR